MSNGINMNSLQKQININIPLNIKQIQSSIYVNKIDICNGNLTNSSIPKMIIT